MIIAGGNEGITTKGKPLRDGGAAIIESGKLVYASGEERHTRVKADGGYSSSLAKGMGVDGVDGVDVLWLSSCCEPLRRSEVSKHYVDHHLSHAALAYYASGFERALVIVVDDGGNVLDSMSGNSWWEYPRQQLTIFEGKGDNLSLLGREFSLPLACGLGEFYRAFTYFLGWPSGRHAGKLMAMSGHGPRFSSDHDPFFRFHRTRLAHKAKFFHPARPKDTARSFLTAAGRDDLIEKLARNKDGFSARAEIASMVQHSLEINLVTLVKQWARALDVENVCMAGGVALNCTAALRVREETGLNVFVPPAAGDMGQCVGNAITGYVNATGKRPEIASWAFIGPDMNISEMEVRSVVKKYRNQMRIRHVAGVKKNTEAARALFDGEIVFWHQGRSEFGQRALGNRSILASPQYPGIRGRLNKLKGREYFNPFAASCLYVDKDRFFEDALHSPYMTTAFRVKASAIREIAAVVHEDKTCRAQIFKEDFNRQFFALINEFKRISGMGIVLNTSLNGPGEPICETVDDTIAFFAEQDIARYAFIGDFLVEKGPQETTGSA